MERKINPISRVNQSLEDISDNIQMRSDPSVYFKQPRSRLDDIFNRSKLEKRRYLCVENKWERLLFKYKACCEQHLTDYILNSYFYMSDSSQLNDPFDLKSNVIFDKTSFDAYFYKKHLISKYKPKFKERKKLQNRMSNPDDIQQQIRQSFLKSIKNTGIHSFTNTCKNLLMWAQYADKHQGVCLIFEVCEDIDTFTSALKINYSKNYPVVKYMHEKNGADLIEKPFLTKSEDWKYESEWRIFDLEKAKHYLYFKPKSLFGIILGAKITETNKKMVYSLLRQRAKKGFPEVKVFDARCSDTEYKLQIWRNNSSYYC